MKPILLKITAGSAVSFSARSDALSYKNNNWHYHPEIEMIHVVKGEGTLFAGDAMHYFKNGDLVLLGREIPHYWKFDDKYVSPTPKSSYIELTQFRDDFWGRDFLQLPENKKIAAVLERAKNGMVIKGAQSAKIKTLLTELIAATETRRIILLLEILMAFAECKKVQYITSNYAISYTIAQHERINIIYDYTLKHFKSKIYIKEVAQISNLTENSFCRYFKSCTRKSYSQFLIELRIGHACKLLAEGKKSIKEICYESGFNSFTFFNRQFKKLKGIQPNAYKKAMDL